MKKLITYAEAINEALHDCMALDKKVICMGLGINDPKNIFGTTKNLEKNLEVIEFLTCLLLKMQ